jgi:hypothetical protein
VLDFEYAKYDITASVTNATKFTYQPREVTSSVGLLYYTSILRQDVNYGRKRTVWIRIEFFQRLETKPTRAYIT